MINQKTLKAPVSLTGVGIHSGQSVSMVIKPAPVHTGIVFRRIDLNPVVDIKGLSIYVGDTTFCTTLVKEGHKLSMVEHVLSALAGLEIDNALIEVNGLEVPIFDGSAYPIVEQLLGVGFEVQTAPKQFLKIKKTIEVKDQDRWAKIEPFEGFSLSFQGNYQHPAISSAQQHATVNLSSNSIYIDQISKARTFGFLSDLEYLRSKNLALGGSLENAIVLDENKILNPEGLRYPNELVRHKILDAIGDLYLLGSPVLGAFSGYHSGHSLNYQLVSKILETPSAWEKVN